MSSSARTQPCGRAEATTRLRQAESFLSVAELVLDDESDAARASVAAALTVLAGMAASDAACCARLGRRPRGQSHGEAVPILATVEPNGEAMAKDLKRLLQRKDDAHDGLSMVADGEARDMVAWARRLLDNAREAVAA